MPHARHIAAVVSGAVNVVERICFCVSCLGIVAMMLLVSADALGRFIFASPIAGAYEITEDYLMVMVVFLSLSYGFRRNAFVRVTSFTRLVPVRLLVTLERTCAVLATLVAAAMAIGGLDTTLRAIRIGEFSSNLLQYPLAPAYSIVVVGATLLCVRLLQSIFVPVQNPQTDGDDGPSFE